MISRVAVFGGTSYLASLLKSQKSVNNIKYIFFSRKKKVRNYIYSLQLKKNHRIINKFDFIIHLVGPNQNQLKKNKNLIKKKNIITSKICDLCLTHNIKLIYVSSMQIYKNYGKSNLSIKSKINQKNSYSRAHYESEKIIKKKFLNNKNMFTILRMGNVFGFKKFRNVREINNNLVNNLCYAAIKKGEILIKDSTIQRTFVPSNQFIQMLNFIIRKNIIKNSIINVFYKNLNLYEISKIIQKRFKLLFGLDINIIVKKINTKKKFIIYPNKYLKIYPVNIKIYFEIDQILKKINQTIKQINII